MVMLTLCISVLLCLCAALSAPAASAAESTPATPHVDFGYAFGYPHRVTVGLPDSSDKTLVDCEPGKVTIAWTNGNLLNAPLASFTTPKTDWKVVIQPEVDGKKIEKSTWHRGEGWLPVLESDFTSATVTAHMEIVGGAHGAMVRVDFTNTDKSQSHRAGLDCTVPSHWRGVNLAFVDPDQNQRYRDSLVAGWTDRADRVVVTALGGEDYKVAVNTVHPLVDLKPGETKTVWLIHPLRVNQSALPEVRARDWPREFAESKEVWRKLIARATQLKLPDEGVRNAYYAGLADFFIMREPVARDYLGIIPGTEVYRASNPTEGAIVSVALVQAGLPLEAAEGYRMSLDQQGFDGCWADPEGWGWGCWFCSGLKSWFIIEHYLNTHDRGFLADVFPRMLASSRWQERARQRMRVMQNGQRPLNYGMLPPGMGDAGLKNDDSLYGVFIPDNIWAVYGDELTLRAAEILGLAKETAEARAIYETAKVDLITTMRAGAIIEKDFKWIPGVAGKTSGSRWGALNAAFPTRILAPDDELITGTIRKMESKLSPGGIPMHTGWMEDGMWVAITLDNLAETLLLRGDGDAFSKYLYATLNHGTPLYSWCEERAPEPGATKITGDRQHLWTPLAVVRAVRDGFVFEDGDVLHLARGTDRSWLARGPVGGSNFSTHFGKVAYQLTTDAAQATVHGDVTLTAGREPATLRIHVRLPAGRTLKSVSDPAARIIDNGEALEWTKPPSHLQFAAEIH
jgi:hypothetical protein